MGHDGGRGAAYVENWLKVLQKEPREIYHAASEAQKISDYLTQPMRDRAAEAEKKQGGAGTENTPTQPGRRSATHPAPRRKRKHRNWNGTQAPVASPVRITDV